MAPKEKHKIEIEKTHRDPLLSFHQAVTVDCSDFLGTALIRSKESLVRFLFATGVLTMADINEVVVRGSAAGFAQEILAGRHPLTADEPVTAGGADTGPTPYDLLLLPWALELR